MPPQKMPGLRQALKAVRQGQRAANREAMGDYRVALSASDAGVANLRTQLGRIERTTMAEIAQGNRGLAATAKGARRGAAQTRAVQNKTVERYGRGLGDVVSQAFDPAKAQANAAVKVTKGQQKAGAGQTRVANTVLDIAQAGVQAQASAATYSLNQALMSRNLVSAETFAGLTADLYKTALQYNQQLALYEQQRSDMLADAKAAEMDTTHDTLAYVTDVGPQLASWLTEGQETGKFINEETGKFDVNQALAAYAQEFGLDPDLNESDKTALQLAQASLQKMMGGEDPLAAVNGSVDRLFGGMAGYDVYGPTAISAISAGTAAATESHAAQVLSSLNLSAEDVQIPGFGETYQKFQGTGSASFQEVTPAVYRDSVAAALQQNYGGSVARAWLRGETDWSDDAINWYLSEGLNGVQAAVLGAPATTQIVQPQGGAAAQSYSNPSTPARDLNG